MLPAPSVAVTENECAPRASPVSVNGFEHATVGAPSTEQSNWANGSELKTNWAVVSVVLVAGPDVKDGAPGAPVSRVQAQTTGSLSMLPVESTLSTYSWYAPSTSRGPVKGSASTSQVT